MLAKVNSYGLSGIIGFGVELEIDVNNGLPGMEMVGLASVAVKEAKERVKSAIKNSGFKLPPKKMTVNLAPADIKKDGSFYDLGIALGILYATEQFSCDNLLEYIIIGELSLDGNIRHVKGIMPILISAKEAGFKKIIVPLKNAKEASYVDGVDVFAFDKLKDVIVFCRVKC